jgi:hypothetical protein
MSGRLSFRWIWIVLAAALACLPAEAQDGYGYSSIDIDSYGNIAGTSLTEVPYYFPDFGYDAYVEGILNGPGGEIMDVIGYDNGEGLAEVDTSGTVSGTGDYAQWGYHEVVTDDEYEYEDIGTTDADVYWTAPCTYPDTEVTTFASPPWKSTSGDWSTLGSYLVTVSDISETSFYGRTFREVDAGGSYDSCWAAYNYGQDLAPIPPMDPSHYPTIGGGFGGNTYGDYVGYYASTLGDIVANLSYPSLPCGYVLNQAMQMLCEDGVTWQTWVTNALEDNVIDTSGDFTVCRASGGVSPVCETGPQ